MCDAKLWLSIFYSSPDIVPCQRIIPVAIIIFFIYFHLLLTLKWCIKAACVDNGSPKTDGGWTEWSNYTTCSRSCDGGVRYRERTCTNPPWVSANKYQIFDRKSLQLLLLELRKIHDAQVVETCILNNRFWYDRFFFFSGKNQTGILMKVVSHKRNAGKLKYTIFSALKHLQLVAVKLLNFFNKNVDLDFFFLLILENLCLIWEITIFGSLKHFLCYCDVFF